MRRTMLLAAALVAAFSFPAHALTITNDLGGDVAEYLARWHRLAHSNEVIRIAGPCHSACTLLLGSIPASRICVTSRASLGFHKAWTISSGRKVEAPYGTAVLWANYPQGIRTWITAHGGLTPEIKSLSGAELRSMYRPCP